MKKDSPFLEDIYNFAVGFCMGGANVIPGVSGGTMLFIMGAFNKLTMAISTIASIDTLKLFLKAEWKVIGRKIPWRFLFGVLLGIAASFATLAKFTVHMLDTYPQLTYGFFFGLITASIITVNRQIKKWSFGAVICFAASAAAAFFVISMVPINGGSQWYMLMLYGAICVIAMILPGLSGSFLLLIFGQYQKVWDAVGNITRFKWDIDEVLMLLLLISGGIIGLGIFVHLLNFLMKRFCNACMAALTGFMVGAIPRLWPWHHENIISKKFVLDAPSVDSKLPWIILCAIAGLCLVLLVDRLAKSKKTEE